MHFAFLLSDNGGISELWFTRCGDTASGLDFALYGSFLPVLVGHFVKSQQGAAAGQRLCKAEFAEGRLHAAVADAVVSDLVWGKKHRLTGAQLGKRQSLGSRTPSTPARLRVWV